MISSFLKIVWRRLARNWQYTFINIVGLSVGIASFFLIMLYVFHESSYDNWHEEKDRIYRMVLKHRSLDQTISIAKIPHSMAEHVQDDIPDVEKTCRLFRWKGYTVLLKHQEKVYEEPKALFADSSFFDLFKLKILKGKKDKILSKPNSIVLTEKQAEKYFGTSNPIGQTLRILPDGGKLWKGDQDLIVTGVCSSMPVNSHFSFDLLISSGNLTYIKTPDYLSYTAYTYLLLKPEVKPNSITKKLPKLIAQYASGQLERENGISYKIYQAQGNSYIYSLQSLQDIHLISGLTAELESGGSKREINLYTSIAFFILLIAIINYMNLATARSAERVKEVGIRKTLGSQRKHIAIRFLLEAVVLTTLSFLFALLWLYMVLPVFSLHTDINFSIAQVLRWQYIPIYLCFVLFLGTFSGSYPAFVLSSYSPSYIVKSNWFPVHNGNNLRNGLILFQFAISVFLFISTIVVYHQLKYIQSKDLGFEKEQILVIQGTRFLKKGQIENLKTQLSNLPEVSCVGGGYGIPSGNAFRITFQKENAQDVIVGNGVVVDDYYLDCMSFQLIEGRSFSKDFNDTLMVVINETAAKTLNIKDPVGKKLVSRDRFLQRGAPTPAVYTIAGVIKDFHYQSLHKEIMPFFFVHNNLTGGLDRLVYMNVHTDQVLSFTKQLQKIWSNISSERPFQFTFLDQGMAALYKEEQAFQKIFTAFSLLAVFIACIGLFGLVSFIAEKRSKEISIRKVLGASVLSIVQLLLKDFLKLSIGAFLIAIPFAWYFMNQWLENFAYRIEIQWWMFAVAGLLGVMITVFTVSFHSIKVALSKPIQAIREE